MGEILDLAEALWQGETDTVTHHPFGLPRGIERLAEGTWFYRGFSNTIIRETGDGLIIIDPAASFDTKIKFDAIRSVTPKRLCYAVFTHGHVDHTFGVPDYVEEAKSHGWPRPLVVAHRAILNRFRRYRATATWNAHINLRQFRGGKGEPSFPDTFYDPDITYEDRTTLKAGAVTAQLVHARGETDDHTWIFFPDNRVLCTGDLFIWGVPNAGNPQKVQRYAEEWALALREMAALEPEILAPGHGLPIMGAARVRQALEDTADLLDSLHEQTLALMNQGACLDEILHRVQAPAALINKPYLKPIYDDPEFIVRNIWRFYGGWYDGLPSRLKPAPDKSLAEEIARLAGGADRLAARAGELASDGDLRLACHLADWAYLASPADVQVKKVSSEVFLKRARLEPSTMAIGIYTTRAREMDADVDKRMPGQTVIHAQDIRGQKNENPE